MQGKWPGKEEAVQAPPFPVFCTRSQQGGVKTMRHLVRARLSPPNGGGDLSSATSMMGRCGIHMPLHFERYCQRRRWGQREYDTLPPVSFHFEQGQHLLPLFLFFSNGGSKCCLPLSFLFERGQHSLPLFLFVLFRMGAACAAPISFHFEWGWPETNTPLPFLLFTTPQ